MFIHKTKVRIDRNRLSQVVDSLKENYEKIGTRETHEGRSRFSAYNNISKFQERLSSVVGDIIDVQGEAKGSSARVYYKPSITSLAMPFRECIVPIKEGNKFVFFDIKSAEFFMNCVFCGEVEAVQAYQRGEDIYMYYKGIFPPDTPRAVIKETLIANMYGVTSYTVSKRLGCSESYAQNILNKVSRALPRMTAHKAKVIAYARRHNAYFAPNGFDQTNLIKIADVDGEFKPLLALSAYVQSALGLFVQGLITKLQPKCKGTILTVFDAVAAEINPKNFERYKAWIDVNISPFRVDKYAMGNNFLEAKKLSE